MSTARKFWHLLNSRQRRAVVLLLCAMVMGMVLETLSIGVVIPAMALMTQDSLAVKYPIIAPWLVKLGNPTSNQLVVAGMLVLVAVYLVKVIFLSFLVWWQAKFVYELQAALSQRLFASYLRQPYSFHLQRNSAQLIRTTIGQVTELMGILQQSLLLITETLVLAGVLALLFVAEPLGTLTEVGILSLVIFSFARLTRSYSLRLGTTLQHHEGLRIQHLQQGLSGVKDVKLLGREDNFLNQYKVHNEGCAKVVQRYYTLQSLPRLWVELLAVIGLAVLVLVMLRQGKPLDVVLSALGLFAAATFRFMPSANRIFNAIQAVHYGQPVVDILHSELFLMKEPQPSSRHGQAIQFKDRLVLDDVSYTYPMAASPSLCEVSLSIPQGASVGFVGGSGAGKSTLVDLILGLLTPSSGVIRADGVDIQANLRSWQDQIGYVPQTIFLTDDTLRRNVAFGLSDDKINEAALWRAIHAAQLEQLVRSLPEGLDTIVGERGIRLSGGQRQRIGIARALYHDPSVLVLDEATSSLDMATESDVMDAVRALRGSKTILIVAHRLSTVEYCDVLFCLEGGKIAESPAVTKNKVRKMVSGK